MTERTITRIVRPIVGEVSEIVDVDGTRKDVDSELLRVEFPSTVPVSIADGSSPIDALTAAQFGLFQIVGALAIESVDRTEFFATGEVQSRRVGFRYVFFDWPDDTLDTEVPQATIRLVDEATYEYPSPQLHHDEDDVEHVLGDNAILKVAMLRCTLAIDCIVGVKDDRAALRKALEDALLGEVSTDERGRRVKIDHYHDQVARYQLMALQMPDGADEAHGHLWPLVALVSAEIPVVRLVRAPPPFDPIASLVELGPDVDPDD